MGAAFTLTDRTVIRGGGGRFFADPGSHTAYWTKLGAYALHPQILNDGRADFAANPFNGPIPTFDEVAATLCTVARTPTCLRRSLGTFAAPYNEIPYSNQASIGVQRQFGQTMSFEADYVYTGLRAQNYEMNVNLAYDPATGVNYPFTNISQAALSRLGHGDEPAVGRRVRLPRPADGLHQALQPIAGRRRPPICWPGSGTCRTRRSRPAASTSRR